MSDSLTKNGVVGRVGDMGERQDEMEVTSVYSGLRTPERRYHSNPCLPQSKRLRSRSQFTVHVSQVQSCVNRSQPRVYE